MQSQFYGDHDRHGNPIPGENTSVKEWEDQNYLMSGSLLSRSCQSTLELAGYDTPLQEHGFEFGKCMGLAMQVQADLQPFIHLNQYPPGTPFSLTSAPIILHLQNDSSLLDYIQANGHISVENLDYKKVKYKIYIFGIYNYIYFFRFIPSYPKAMRLRKPGFSYILTRQRRKNV